MDDNFVSQTLFWIITGGFSLLLTVIGTLINNAMKKNEKEMQELKVNVKENKSLIDGRLESMLKEFQTTLQDFTKGIYEIREAVAIFRNEHSAVKDKVKEMNTAIHSHNERLLTIENNCVNTHERKRTVTKR